VPPSRLEDRRRGALIDPRQQRIIEPRRAGLLRILGHEPADQHARATGLDDSLLTRIDESAAASILESARWYLRRDDAVSARSMLRRVIRQHPISDAARQAREIMSENGWTMPGEKPAEMIPDQATPASAAAGAAAGTDGAVNAPPVPPRPDGPAVPAGPGNAEGKK
ncbi:MAG: tetratricopeptide repeat protein, partial [Planctomyces sp.]